MLHLAAAPIRFPVTVLSRPGPRFDELGSSVEFRGLHGLRIRRLAAPAACRTAREAEIVRARGRFLKSALETPTESKAAGGGRTAGLGLSIHASVRLAGTHLLLDMSTQRRKEQELERLSRSIESGCHHLTIVDLDSRLVHQVELVNLQTLLFGPPK